MGTRRSDARWRHPAAPHALNVAGHPTMRSGSPRHRNIRAPRSRRSRHLPGVILGVSSAVILAISCSDQGAPTADSVARAAPATAALSSVDAVTSAPVVVTGPNEPARGIVGGYSAEVAPTREALDEAQEKVAEQRRSAPPPTPSPPALPGAAQTTQVSASSMIIRNGNAGIEVDSLDTAIARVRALAQRVGGFVANTAVQGGRDQLRSASLEVKVPADRFDDALSGLAPIGKVESVNVSAQDVGEEYVDIAARVENAHRLEARLIALLANRTGKLQDVLSVERELARVREEIERYEGRLRFLRARVAMSTLTVNVHERAPIIVPVAGDGPIVVAFREAWRNFVGFVAAVIASLGVVIPLGALVFVGWLGVRRWTPWRPNGGTPPAAGSVAGD